MVSDYKMPTFEITANPVLNDAPQKEMLLLAE